MTAFKATIQAFITHHLLLITVFTSARAQMPENVAGLLSADRAAASLSKTEGPRRALLSIADKASVLYTPAAVNALHYLNDRPNLPKLLSWEPNFALVAKSQDWGVTSGRTAFRKTDAARRYGQYLAVWHRTGKGRWKIRLRAEVEHEGEKPKAGLAYYEPDGSWYLRPRSKARLEQREEVVMQTDHLFSTVLKADNAAAFREFMVEDVRYHYPREGEIEGRDKVLAFLKNRDITIETVPSGVDRAYSGEYACTTGTATVRTGEKEARFSYIRIWQLENDYQWRVLLEMMFER